MIIKGKIVPDWDKSKISTAYQKPNQFKVITWDMGRVQGWLLGQTPLARNFIEKVIR
jgi:pantothenate kinase-related protein Tda10